MDEVFGEANFLAQVVVNLNPKGRQLGNGFATNHEYLLVHARDARTTALTQAAPTPSTRATSRSCPRPCGRRFRHLPCATPTRSSTRSPPPRCTSRSGATRTAARSGPRPSRMRWRSAGLRGRDAPVWRWSRPLIDERPDDLVCRRINGAPGERVDVFQRDWLPPRRFSTGAESCGRSGSRRRSARPTPPWPSSRRSSVTSSSRRSRPGWCAGSSPPCRTTPRVLDFFAGSGTTGHAVALQNAEDGGTRTCLSVNSAEPTRGGVERPQRRAARGRRHHPGAAARGRRDGAEAGSTSGPDGS